ncbi:MAG TPA: endolytic transglycosylase MltG [Candidatus Pullichristensenella excrementipullorum]|nr:endolytic transglycosylase MltG [Candidatus Pullichristensenella excrementipullorum]
MAGKKQAPRQEREQRPFSRPMRYDQRTVREEREYGVYWYAWLWRVLRPVTVFFCAVLIVIGLVTMGWNSVYEAFLMPVDPENTQTVRFTIESGDSISEIGENLEKAQLLRNRTVFRYLVQFLGVTDKISYGTFDLSPSMDVNAIIDELSSGSQNAERTITIIPGWTVEDIADYLYAEGAIQSREEFLNLCRDAAPFAEMSYPIKLAQDMGTLSGRKYQLEGYLAPDTYRVFRNASAQQIVNTLVEQTNTVIDEVYYADTIQYEVDPETGEYREVVRYRNDDLTLDEIIILASMIEKEAANTEDYARVSAVFTNRMNAGMRLESDPTATYLLGVDKLALSDEETSAVNNYNTYVIDGLPVGPICNPSAAAMEAALYPDVEYVDEGYLYFCAKEPTSGELAFAKTLEEHEANVAKYRPLWEEYDRQRAQQQSASDTSAQ